MPIYDLFEHGDKREQEDAAFSRPILPRFLSSDRETILSSTSTSFFAAVAARFLFFILLIVDIVWGHFALILGAALLVLNSLSLFRVPGLRRWLRRYCLHVKRSFICGIALFVALFSPSLGMMYACVYFLMHDPKGMKEVVPSILQEQFQEIFEQ